MTWDHRAINSASGQEASAFQLREAKASDYTQLQQIYLRARRACDCFDAQFITMERLHQLLKGETVHVAERDGCPLGFIAVIANESFIHHLYTDPAAQGQGVASALLDLCEQRYPLPLKLTCIASNHNACRFYRNRGWAVISQLKFSAITHYTMELQTIENRTLHQT
jgi:GNAT superfamily N-acetyltransferase